MRLQQNNRMKYNKMTKWLSNETICTTCDEQKNYRKSNENNESNG